MLYRAPFVCESHHVLLCHSHKSTAPTTPKFLPAVTQLTFKGCEHCFQIGSVVKQPATTEPFIVISIFFPGKSREKSMWFVFEEVINCAP